MSSLFAAVAAAVLIMTAAAVTAVHFEEDPLSTARLPLSWPWP